MTRLATSWIVYQLTDSAFLLGLTSFVGQIPARGPRSSPSARPLQNPAAALADFNAARDRTVQEVLEPGDSLYSMGAAHPRFGKMNGAELIHLIDGHARRHADQIRETCEALTKR